MNRGTLKSRTGGARDQTSDGPRGALHVVDGSTQIVEWRRSSAEPEPGSETPPCAGALPRGEVIVQAEVRTKRFRDRRVDAERYTATLRAADTSPHALVVALAEACGDIDELRSPGALDDRMIL